MTRYFSPEHRAKISAAKKGASPSVRFWSRVDKSETSPDAQRGEQLGIGACWLWTGGDRGDGYGAFDEERAHVWAFKNQNGDIPRGHCVLHRCDTRKCVRGSHLFTGTRRDNIADMDAKGRRTVLRGDRNGNSKLTWEQVEMIRSSRGRVTRRALAEQFAVSRSTIDAVLSSQKWVNK